MRRFDPAARTLRLTIAYDGTNYVGWQRQARGLSIQQVIEDAFVPLFEKRGGTPRLTGAGRTDAGAHAVGQVASLVVPFTTAADAVHRALNIRLPPDIRVLDVADANPGFHARFDARRKIYRYRIVTAPVVMPFDRWSVWHVPQRCDVDAMRSAATALVGRHDFAAFQAGGSRVADTVRAIHRLDVSAVHDGVVIEAEGDGFLRHMVRIIAGTLVDVGCGTRPIEWPGEALATGTRTAAGRTAPAAGLTLVAVLYP